MSEAPAELWLTPHEAGYYDYDTGLPREPDAVRYVRADLYEALMDLFVEAPCLEPLGEETVFLTPAQQRVMHRALRRSLRIIDP